LPRTASNTRWAPARARRRMRRSVRVVVESPQSGPADRPQPAGDPRWLDVRGDCVRPLNLPRSLTDVCESLRIAADAQALRPAGQYPPAIASHQA
jgi:hypothetical protein